MAIWITDFHRWLNGVEQERIRHDHQSLTEELLAQAMSDSSASLQKGVTIQSAPTHNRHIYAALALAKRALRFFARSPCLAPPSMWFWSIGS